jgi:hypothetical protein
MAPAASSAVPPLMVMPTAVPPEATSSDPPLLTVVPLVTPPPETLAEPPLSITVPLAIPPDSTTQISGTQNLYGTATGDTVYDPVVPGMAPIQ